MAAQTKSSGKDPWHNQATPGKSEGVVEIRASGHGSEEGEDSITFPERRTRGSRWSLACARGGLALVLADELGMRPLVAHCHFGPGNLYGRTGDGAKAHEHLTTAVTLYREMDMGLWLVRTEAALR
jgi:hypothetical protein